MKLTGERPMQDATPDSLLALHDAGYREVVARLGPGIVLDVGCGVGDETVRLEGDGRFVIGADYDAATAVDAGREWGPGGRRDTTARFVAMDGSHLGVRDGSVDWLCSSHIIEHFTAPEGHVAELARALHPDGTAFVITPNAPADFENPFHVYLFEADQLASMLGLFFDEVEMWGLEGDDAIQADFAARRRSGEKILRLDPFELRKKIPHKAYVWGYTRALPVVYRLLGSSTAGVGSGLDATHFSMTRDVTRTTPVLFAVARKPKPRLP